MKLTDEEQALRAGAFGPAAQWAIEHQIKVGDYLGAADFVPVTQAHIMADTESLGPAGVEWLERMARLPAKERRVRIPTITDPRGTDFAAAHRLKHQPWMVDLERRAVAAFEALGVLMTDTCINYQTIMPPVRGEHVAYGDTGVVIYSNSVCGARSNFEAGRRRSAPGSLAAPRATATTSTSGAKPRCASTSNGHRASSMTGARSAGWSAAWRATTGRCRLSSASTAFPAPTR
jgi:predicted aconitase